MSISHRSFLSRASPLAAGAAFSPGSALGKALSISPGVQLWTANELARDSDGTLRALAELGYLRVDSAGWRGRTA